MTDFPDLGSRDARPLRICLVSAAYLPYPSGVSEHVAGLAGALTGLGHDVEVLTANFPAYSRAAPNGEGERRPTSLEARVHRVGRTVRVPGNGSYATLPVGWRLPRAVADVLREGRYDVVHCHGFLFPEHSFWALRHDGPVRVVSLLSAGFSASTRGGRAFRFLYRGTLRRIDAVIALSRWASTCHAAYIPPPHHVIGSGVDHARFRPGLPPPPAIAAAPTPRILFVGRLEARKGLEMLLAALPRVFTAVPEAHLVVVGGGPGLEAARARSAELGVAGRVLFAGVVSRADLPGAYSGSHVYVSPALGGESFGLVLLEAMASGTPVVATRIPGYEEVLSGGACALLVPPRDPSALADAVIKVLREPATAQRLAVAGRARAAEFAWPRIAAQTLAVYESASRARSSATLAITSS